MALDLLITNGTVIDGTGAPGRKADLAVQDGHIVAVEPGQAGDGEAAARGIDASDLVVAPGFIDVHTHYDAQGFWDTTLSPSGLHGFTTVVGGNCGFTIAPLSGDPDDAEYLCRMLARVEGMPLASLEAGVPWDWRTTAEYLDRLDRTLSLNTAFMVGHSALRRAVMHEESITRPATEAELEAMKELLRDGIRAGAMGFSSTWARTHNDHLGNPVPSRHATVDELLALSAVAGEFPGTTLEFIPGTPPFDDDLFALMADMSKAANRPINWNALAVGAQGRTIIDALLTGTRHANQLGGRVVGLTIPDAVRNRLNFKSAFLLDSLPGWDRLMHLPDDEKIAMLADPAGRAEMDRLAQSAQGGLRMFVHWEEYVIGETFSPGTKKWEGMSVGDIAAQTGQSPWDALATIVAEDELRTVITLEHHGDEREAWKLRTEVWRDPNILLGASDAGAHMDMIDVFGYPSAVLAKAVREYELLSLEEAVNLMTAAPAALYGLKDRGSIRPGAWADLVIFDPATIGPGPVTTRFDLPRGAGRLYGGAVGVEHVLVAGTEIVTGGEFTAERPGRVLRSGQDTTTVTVTG